MFGDILTEAAERGDATAGSSSATNEDVSAASATLNYAVDKKCAETTLPGLKSASAEVSIRLTSTEEATQSHKKWTEELDGRNTNSVNLR